MGTGNDRGTPRGEQGASRSGRRRWPAALLPGLVLAAWGCGEGGRSPDAVPGPGGSVPGSDAAPGVVLILVDTMRADHLGAWGFPGAATPAMDRLARSGSQFRTCISQVPVTAPSTTTILTGTFPPFHGVRDNGSFELRETVPTVAEQFARAGWTTAGFVSTTVLDRKYGLARGFDTWDDDMSVTFRFFRPEFESSTASHQGIERRADDTVERAVAWIDSLGPGPFLLMVHFFDPHAPADAPAGFVRPGAGSQYDAEIASVDRAIGRLLTGLARAERLGNTIVALAADHGEGGGQHGELTHGFFVYDATMHVPLLFHGPGLPARVTRDLVRLADVAPTLLELAGLGSEEFGQGRSLAGTARGRERLTPEPAYLENWRVRYSYEWHELEGLRTERWKYVRAPRPELYDVERDPLELVDLHDALPDTAARLSEAFDRFLESVAPSDGSERRLLIDEETEQRLRALGYVTGDDDDATTAGPDSRPDPKDRMEAFNRRHETNVIVSRAHELKAAGREEEARAMLERALEGAPESAFARWMKGRFLLEDGRGDEARRLWEAVLEDSPGDVRCLTELARYHDERGEPAAARRYLERAFALKPRPETRDALYYYHLAAFRWDDALAVARDDRPIDPSRRTASHLQAFVLGLAGRTDEEEKLLATILPDDDATARFRGAELEVRRLAPGVAPFLRAGRADRALPLLEKAHAENPAAASIAGELAVARAETGAEAGAVDSLLAPPAPSPILEGVRLYARARAELARDDPGEAAKGLARAARALEGVATPYLGMFLFTRGRAALAAGRTEEANRFFESALEAGYGKGRRQGTLDLEGILRLVRQRSP